MELNESQSSRSYKQLEIPGLISIRSKKYQEKANGWLMENVDFNEISYYLGYRFEPRTMYSIWSEKGVIRGGHLEGRSKIVTVKGMTFHVLVDMRPGSSQGKVVQLLVGEDERAWGNSILVPDGVIDSFVPIDDDSMYIAVGDRPFNRFDSLKTLDLFDPALGVSWPEGTSELDKNEETEILNLKDFIASL
jgi:dTDP-4-dehydrorhamnose 3,5-epimerase-like enzyme